MSRRRASASRAVPGPEAPRTWGVLVAEVDESLEEDLGVVLGVEGLGSETRAGSEGRAEVRLYFPSTQVARSKLEVVRRLLAEDPTCQLRVDEVEDRRWVEAFQASLRPFELGTGFRVHPEGGDPPAEDGDGRRPILLVPGQAFGTGEHETTRLCAALLEGSVRPGQRWLDLGCGTGILSVVAHHRGAAEVQAYDNDPQAVSVAREVLGVNRLDHRVRVAEGSVREAASRQWHGVVANIELPFFLSEAPRLAALLMPGGRLIASGFLGRDVEEVTSEFEQAGLSAVETALDGPWAAVVAERRES
jgi:ribosomal protein L11 methyltransferase